MSSSPTSAAPVPSLPAGRDFRSGAHQALLASNGRDTFYVDEIQRAINGEGSPLACFLPAAIYTGRDLNNNKPASVAYKHDAAHLPTARPLRSVTSTLPGSLGLTRAEIVAFQEAVVAFLAVHNGLTPLQQQCRREFRLPDPVREPDAYWVSGDGVERRLIILWGCERFSRTSVTPDRVAAYMDTCEMGREEKQLLGLQLALRKEEGLSRFLVLPTREPGEFRLRGEGEPLPPKAIKRFTSLGKGEFTAFDQAARAFAAKATHPDTPGFESEARRAFILPSLKALPGRFHRHGARLLIDVAPFEAGHGVPPASLGEAEDTVEPLNRQLARCVKFQAMPQVIGAAVAAVIIIAVVFALVFGPDKEPPEFVEVSTPGGRLIEVRFNERLSPNLESGAVFVADDKLNVTSLRLSRDDEKVLLVETREALVDGEEYVLILTDKITDRAGNALVRVDTPLAYYDPVPPALVPVVGVSAGGASARDLVLTFTKPIDPGTLSPGAISVRPFSAGEAGRAVRIDSVELDKDTPSGVRVLVRAEEDFQSRRQYMLSVRNLSDRARRPNRVEIEDHRFEYVDILPPAIRSIAATGATYTVEVMFSKPIEKGSAMSAANFEIVAGSGEEQRPVRLIEGGVAADERGQVFTLSLERGVLFAGRHRLTVSEAVDLSGNRIEQPLVRAFEFSDAALRGAPIIQVVEADAASNRMTVGFDRGIAPASVTAERFRLLDGNRMAVSSTVTAAASTSDDTRRVILTLASPPLAGSGYFLVAEGLEDIFGTRQSEPVSREFRPSGTGIVMQNIPISRPPELVGGDKVRFHFDFLLTQRSAVDVGNYIIVPQGVTPARVDHHVRTPGEGARPYSEVILHFAAPLVGEVRAGAQNLEVENMSAGQRFRVRPVPAVAVSQ